MLLSAAHHCRRSMEKDYLVLHATISCSPLQAFHGERLSSAPCYYQLLTTAGVPWRKMLLSAAHHCRRSMEKDYLVLHATISCSPLQAFHGERLSSAPCYYQLLTTAGVPWRKIIYQMQSLPTEKYSFHS